MFIHLPVLLTLQMKPAQCLRVMRVIDLIFEAEKQDHGMTCHI